MTQPAIRPRATEPTLDQGSFVANVGSPAELVELVSLTLGEEGAHALHRHIPAPELLVIAGGKADYQLRGHDVDFPVRNIVGVVAPRHFMGAFRAGVLDFLRKLTVVAPGEWRIVAVMHETVHRSRWDSFPTGVSQEQTKSSPSAHGAVPTEDSPQMTEPRLIRDPVLRFTVAFAEVTQQAPIDPLYETRQLRIGHSFRFAESGGLLKFMPRSLRASRAKATEAICSMYGLDPESALLQPLSETDTARVVSLRSKGLTNEEIAAVVGATLQSVEAVPLAGKPPAATRPKRSHKGKPPPEPS
jgi:hypothetical protein